MQCRDASRSDGRERRETSVPNPSPPWPRLMAATSRSQPVRFPMPAADRPRAAAMTWRRGGGQPICGAFATRGYGRGVLSGGLRTCGAVDGRIYTTACRCTCWGRMVAEACMAVSLLRHGPLAVPRAVPQSGPQGNQMPVYRGTAGAPPGGEGPGRPDDRPPGAGERQATPPLSPARAGGQG
jgi:hypothetical protein